MATIGPRGITVLSGQKTVAVAGTAERAGTDTSKRKYYFSAPNGNTGNCVYIGNDGNDDVSSTTGLALLKGNSPVIITCALYDVWVDVDTSGDALSWFAVLG